MDLANYLAKIQIGTYQLYYDVNNIGTNHLCYYYVFTLAENIKKLA